MGFMLIGGNPDYGSQMAQAERGRSALIQSGMNAINTVFDGGSMPSYQLATGSYDPNQTYYKFSPGWKGDAVFRPYGHNGVQKPGGQMLGNYGRAVAQDKLYTQGPTQNFGGFNQNFYNQRANDYQAFALPQLAQQYDQTKRAIDYGMANRGLTGSSAASNQISQLNRQNTQGKQSIADAGISQANALQNQVQAARDQLISQLYQTANPSQGVSQAISTAAQFQQPSTFAPIANTFSGLANQYYLSQLMNQGQGTGAMGYNQPPVYYGYSNTGNVGNPYNSINS